MNINLQKLQTIQTGSNLFNTLTAERINAIQDAIKELARGRNVIAGPGINVTHLGGAVNISAGEVPYDTKYKQIQEFTYVAGGRSSQMLYNGRPNYQPYRDQKGIEIPLPRPQNIYDINCEPEPNQPLNVWENLPKTWHVGAEFMSDKGDHMIFLKEGTYEIEMEYTAMHKATACEAAKNTHTFDLLFYPAIANKGKKPKWLMPFQKWDWIQGRTECNGEELRVIFPENAFVHYSIHGKQRLPPDHEVFIELYDSEKKVGLRAEGGIKYKPGVCSSFNVPTDDCGFVRDDGTPDGGGCNTTVVKIPYCELLSSNQNVTITKNNYYLTSVSNICSLSYSWDSLYDPCDTSDIPQWELNTTYQVGDVVAHDDLFFICTQVTNTTEPQVGDDIFWREYDPCAVNYNVAVCDGSEQINVFDSYENQTVYFTQNRINKISENSTTISGSLSFDVPVSFTSTLYNCTNTAYSYTISSVYQSTHSCPGWSSSVSADIVIPTALVSTDHVVYYDYPEFSTSAVHCGGAVVDVDVTNTTIQVPTTISSTSVGEIPELSIGTSDVNYTVPSYSSDTHVCAGATINGVGFTADLDVPVNLNIGNQDVVGTVTLPKYSDIQVVGSLESTTVEVVETVTATNSDLTIPTISVGSTTAEGCCYCDCSEENNSGGSG